MKQKAKDLQLIKDTEFTTGERVPLDGKRFVNCFFNHCVIEFRGGLHELSRCRMDGAAWESAGPAGNTLSLLNKLGEQMPEVVYALVPQWQKWKRVKIQ